MNRLRNRYETFSEIEGSTVRDVFKDSVEHYGGHSQAVAIKTKDLITHRIFHERSCCELVKVNLPENIENLSNRVILNVKVDNAERPDGSVDYELLANVIIMDSHGEEYIIEFTGKSIGCDYDPCISIQREWVVCVFD